jgi:hypothetical protein
MSSAVRPAPFFFTLCLAPYALNKKPSINPIN